VCLQTVVLCHTWLACQEEANFSSAKEFLPERWLQNGELARNSPFLVVPFGCGRRVCPGKRFAEQQMHLALAKVTVFIHLFFFSFLILPFDSFKHFQNHCNPLQIRVYIWNISWIFHVVRKCKRSAQWRVLYWNISIASFQNSLNVV